MHQFLTSLFFLLLSSSVWAQFGAGAKSQFNAISEVSTIESGEAFQIALKLKHPAGYHSYYLNPGTLGSSLQVKWKLPEGFKASKTSFPVPHLSKTTQGGKTSLSYGYEGEVIHLFTITPTPSLELDQSYPIQGTANWLVCNNNGCLPEDAKFSLQLIASESAEIDSEKAELFTKARKAYPKSSKGWKIKVSTGKDSEKIDPDLVWLHLTPPVGLDVHEPFYFFSADQQVDAQAEQPHDIEKKSGKITLYLERNKGNKDLGTGPGPLLKTLPGIFTYHNESGSEVGIQIGDTDAIAPPTVAHGSFIKATEEQRAAGLELYDINAQPAFVDLSGKKEKKITFASSLGLVFLGGLILNLMPCVFPVLGLKVMSFVSQAGEDETKIKKHGMVFTLGLLVTMWILATIIISFNLNWGEQLSNPIFLGSIIILLFLMGLNLYGLFEFGTTMTSVGGELQAKKGYSGSFFSGVLTTLIATPCSGPFLGAVMGFALSQPKHIALMIFTVFGLGIALPYLLLAFYPVLIKKLPRPGAWMESFKQIMAFLVFATVVFFLRSYLTLVGERHFTGFLFALTTIGLGIYIYGRWGTIITAAKRRFITGYGIAGVFIFGGMFWAYTTAQKEESLTWHEWYPGITEIARSERQITWIDYTAEW